MSRKRDRERIKKKKEQGKPKYTSRRRFVKVAAFLGAATASIYVGSHVFHDDKWDFLARNEWHEIILDYRDILKRYSPIGPELQIKNESELAKIKKEANPILDHQIKIRGFDLPGNYDVKAYSQLFSVPDRKEFREPALEYCKTAFEFLYNHPRLSGLVKPSLEWITVQRTNYEKGFDGNGFIGNSYYDMQKLKVVNKSNPKQYFEYQKPIPAHACGSRLVVAERDKKDGSLKSWFIYISAIEPHVLLSAPFSELTPLTIDSATVKYEDEVGTEKAKQAGETISEGLSHLLALELSDELGIPNGKRLARESINKVRNYGKYRYLPNSVAWIRKNGMQAALDLYLESPRKFMEAVMKI
ncbi:hypothetical protein KY343_06115 [Candidatus Woesearchaeota archaeon]|nr:hypothetical protein [Candidatus Woesearchaeota archaeon]